MKKKKRKTDGRTGRSGGGKGGGKGREGEGKGGKGKGREGKGREGKGKGNIAMTIVCSESVRLHLRRKFSKVLRKYKVE